MAGSSTIDIYRRYAMCYRPLVEKYRGMLYEGDFEIKDMLNMVSRDRLPLGRNRVPHISRTHIFTCNLLLAFSRVICSSITLIALVQSYLPVVCAFFS